MKEEKLKKDTEMYNHIIPYELREKVENVRFSDDGYTVLAEIDTKYISKESIEYFNRLIS